jgi:hypothetical protein
MAAVVLLITVATGIYATINLGSAETKDIANDLVQDKVGQFYDKDLKDACLNSEYDFTDGKHTFSCSLTNTKGGKKSRKSKKSRKNRKSRKLRK